MLRREPIAYTTSESINAQSSRLNFGEFQIKDNLAMLFLHTTFYLSKAGANIHIFFVLTIGV